MEGAGEGLGEGTWNGGFRAVLWEGALGRGGRRALSRVRELLRAEGGRAEGAGAPDTCWGCACVCQALREGLGGGSGWRPWPSTL